MTFSNAGTGPQPRLLLLRDGAACAYCGRPLGTGLPFSRPTLDHVVPLSRGGSNALANLVLACKPCNRAKADRVWPVRAKGLEVQHA